MNPGLQRESLVNVPSTNPSHNLAWSFLLFVLLQYILHKVGLFRRATAVRPDLDFISTPLLIFGFWSKLSELNWQSLQLWPYSLLRSLICMIPCFLPNSRPIQGSLYFSLCPNTHCLWQQTVKPATGLGSSWQPHPPPSFQNKQLLWPDCVLSTGTESYILCL